MVESEAQGRLPGMEPVSVVDIGSNSVRVVIYEGLTRAPAMLFNEKVMCGLGKGLAQNGDMDPDNVERALEALRRFKALARQARSGTIYA
ncbi:MAG: exopolyphosphatase, partial [Rhizobiaceae bacterium]